MDFDKNHRTTSKLCPVYMNKFENYKQNWQQKQTAVKKYRIEIPFGNQASNGDVHEHMRSYKNYFSDNSRK